MDLLKPLVIPKHVTFQSLDGEAVILNLKSEQYFGLDELGTRVWQEIAAGKSFEQIYAHLLEEYEVDSQRLHADLEKLITNLIEQGLLEAGSE